MSIETVTGESSDEIKLRKGQARLGVLRWVGVASLLALLSALAVATAYQIQPNITLDVGGWGDRAYTENFNGGERVADYSYRWTKGDSTVVLPAAGLNGPLNLALRLQGWRPSEPFPVVEILVNGVSAGRINTTGDERVYQLTIPGGQDSTRDLVIELKSPTFVPSGDSRALGVKLDWLSVGPSPGGARFPITPPLEPLLAVPIAVLGVYLAAGAASAKGGWAPAPFLGGLAAMAALSVALVFIRIWLTPYLGWLALASLGAYALTQRKTIVDWLLEWTYRLGERRASLILLGIVTLGAAFFEAWISSQMTFIGHADYADSAVVARNLAMGRGFTVDYVAQFYRDYPASISHPADTWPLLQPAMIAPFFAWLGPTVFASRLPNLVLMAILALVVYWIGSWLLDRRAGLVGALLTLLHPYFFEMAIFPINDLAFTLFFLLTASFFYRNSIADRSGNDPADRGALRWAWGRWPMFALNGLWAGLLVLSKPMGAVLIIALLIWSATLKIRSSGRWTSLRSIVVFGVAAFVTALPLFIRNLWTFGTLFYSTESYDAWILKYRPWENIYNVFTGDLPHPRLLVGYGADLVTGQIWSQFLQLFNAFGNGTIVPTVALLLAVLGAFTLTRDRYRFLSLLVLSFVAYTLFVNLYWHFEARYFMTFVPLLFLFTAQLLFWVADRVSLWRKERDGAVNWLGALLVPVFALSMIVPMGSQIADDIPSAISKTDTVGAAEWLSRNTDPSAVVMSRNPWELNFHSERKTVMIPNGDLQTILSVARKYGVSYLQLDHLNDTDMRPALNELYKGKEVMGFKKVFAGTGVLIYRFPRGSSAEATG